MNGGKGALLGRYTINHNWGFVHEHRSLPMRRLDWLHSNVACRCRELA